MASDARVIHITCTSVNICILPVSYLHDISVYSLSLLLACRLLEVN